MNRQQKLKQKQKQERAIHRRNIRLTDEAATVVYDYAIDQAKAALSRMGFGDVRLGRFMEMLKQVQQDYGINRKE